MITSRQRIQYILSASLLASAAFGASAQTPPLAIGSTGSPPALEQSMNRPHDGKFRERMQERRARHMADLKTKLKLDASQETAWSAFSAALQPPGPTPGHDPKMARAEFEKMTTPQRLDRMQARQAERAATSARRAESTRTFYAALTPNQQKTFDAETLRHVPHGEHEPHGHDGHRPPPPFPSKS